jgi:hypothetical protein
LIRFGSFSTDPAGRVAGNFNKESPIRTQSIREARSAKRIDGLPPAVMSALGLVSRVSPVQTAMRNCTRDEGRSFGFGNQVLISSHRKLLWSKAMVVSVAEKSGHDPVRHG